MLEKQILLVMCSFGIFGQIIGWILFDYLNDQILTGLIGVIAIITVFNYAWRRMMPMKKTTVEIAISVSKRIFQRGALWCGLSGISSFVSLSGGIPAQIFLLPHALARQSFVGTLCVYFLVINIAKISRTEHLYPVLGSICSKYFHCNHNFVVALQQKKVV